VTRYAYKPLCIRRDFCSGQIQKANILKTVAGSLGSVVLSSEVGAHRSLIQNRNSDHKEEGTSRTCEIPLQRLTRPIMVLRVSVCRVSMVVYTHKVS
jgi:hypothetical protein